MAKAPGGNRGPGPYEAELPLDLGDRLPWLEGDDEIERDTGTGRVIAALAVLFLLIVAAIGAFWYVRHRQEQAAMAIAGGVIKAPPGPYKIRPTDPGGSVAAGTGDSAFMVAAGENPRGDLAGDADPTDLATPGAPASGMPGVGVQIGAYGSKDDADKAWPTLTSHYPILSGLGHRIVEMPGDLGSVFGLQVVTATPKGAVALCAQLRAGGLKCEVRD